jgi:hypothetical protein
MFLGLFKIHYSILSFFTFILCYFLVRMVQYYKEKIRNEKMINPPSKVAQNWPNFFIQYCQLAQNQPKSQFLFHINWWPRDLCIMTLRLATVENRTERIRSRPNDALTCIILSLSMTRNTNGKVDRPYCLWNFLVKCWSYFRFSLLESSAA